jgi:hypothetical protein
MRSIKLVSAVATVASAMLVLAPAGASAAKKPVAGAGGCHLNISAAPRLVQAGESALVFGQLTSCNAGTSVAGQTVTLLERSAPSSAATTAGTATTNSEGRYSLPTPALQTNSQFVATALGAKSGRKTVRVSPQVTLNGPPDGSQLFTGGPFVRARGLRSNTVTFTGTVNPANVGATVALQRENTVGVEEWHAIGRVSKVKPGGTYSITHTFAVPGDANIRVIVRASKRNATSASEALSYEISQPQNPALTIQSSANPIFYGQPVTISGTIAAGATQLTLLARSKPQGKLVPVATTTSSGGGSYTFPVQSPLQNTLYQVTGAGKASARVFEGVKYGLTASVSATTVQAGQPLTFSGTVTPGHAGHPVYLQAQYPSGVSFHVVQVGRVTGSTYSITHVPFVAGVKRYRVKVPGDPENQGAASSLFTIQVNAAPAAALKPEPPGNSTPPSEGHL